MAHRVGFRIRNSLALFVSAALVCTSSLAADIPSGGNLTLRDAVKIAIKNAQSLIVAAIQVDLAKADEQEAGDPFDPAFKASAAVADTRGFKFPSELQTLSAFSSTPSSFMTDRKDETEFKTSVNKLFRSGVYVDFSVSLLSSDSDKVRSDFAPAIAGLNASGLKPGAQMSDYQPLHPSIVQMTVNVPLLKFSGENNIAAANENMKRLQREAAEMTLKQAVSAIIQNVVNSYWDYKAALTKLQFTQESEAQVKRWLGKAGKSSGAAKGDKSPDYGKEIAHLQGFATQLGNDVSKASEAASVARAALAQALGISAEEARKIVQAQDDYPLDWSGVLAAFDDNEARKKWNTLAEQNRFDLKAARLQFDAASAIYLGAQNDQQPKLDLALILNQQGLSMGGRNGGDFSSLTTGRGDLGHTVQLSYELKFDDNKAKAQVTRTRYLRMQKEIEFNEVKRGLGLSVDTTVNSVRNSLVGLIAAKKQTEFYVTALDSMVKNDVIDQSKIFDLVVIEQARLKSVTDHVSAIQSVANAVTAAHFQTGSLIKQANNLQEVVISDLTRLP